MPGAPKPKIRPRMDTKRGKVYSIQTMDVRKAKINLNKQIKNSGVSRRLRGPLGVKMWFGIAPPKNFDKRELKCNFGDPCYKKPDLDNYVKFYLDVMNSKIYLDDAQIAELTCSKFYSEVPSTEILVWEMEEKDGK